jgi:hypothetical protein
LGDFLSSISPVITTILGVATLAGIMYNVGRWINNKAELKAASVKAETIARAQEVKDFNKRNIDSIEKQIVSVDEKLIQMVDDLTRRSDLVNGNIANIRTDIADLQEDLMDLTGEDEGQENTKNRIRAAKLKRRRIESDRVSQQERHNKV